MSYAYKLKGKRWLRKYTAKRPTPSTSAASDAAAIADNLCNVPWEEVAGNYEPEFPSYAAKDVDKNAENRDWFDAAEWCADHTDNKKHLCYANACFYRFEMPAAARGVTLESAVISVTCDPYTPQGARISLATTDSDLLPVPCRQCREGDVYSIPDANGNGVAQRVSWTDPSTGKIYWYEKTEDCTLTPAGGLTLKKYLLVFVGLEKYRARNGWLEGAARIGGVTVNLAAEVDGWTEGETVDLSIGENEFVVCRNGVLPELPTAAAPVMALTLQRTGDHVELSREEDGKVVMPDPAHVHLPVTAAEGAMGLRQLYLSLYSGLVPAKELGLMRRPGAAFTVRAMTRDYLCGETAESLRLPCWQMCVSALVVPFSVPQKFRAQKIRLDWPSWQGRATEGTRFNVWLATGSAETYSAEILKDPVAYMGNDEHVGKYRRIGTIDATQTDRTATFEVAPLTGYAATLLFTAFVSMDFVNPSSEADAVYGAGDLDDDWIAGELKGLDTAWMPDVTLIG